MRLTKIQKFLNENNIDYKYFSDIYNNNEFGTININSDKTKYTSISVSEISGNRGNTSNGIIVIKRDRITGKRTSIEYKSQEEIIERLINEMLYNISEKEKKLIDERRKRCVLLRSGVRIDIWTHLMRGCIMNYVH